MKKIFFLIIPLSLTIACNNIRPILSEPISTSTIKTDKEEIDERQELPPNERFGELFEAVQMSKVFPDGKTFVDCTPKKSTKEIMNAYKVAKDAPNFQLDQFIAAHFETPKKYASGFKADTSKTVSQHINSLWGVLTRQPDKDETGSLM